MVRPERSAEASASETCGGDAGFKSHDQTRPSAGRFAPATFRGIATLLGGWTGTIFGADCPTARSADTTYKFTTPPHGLYTPDVKQVINYNNNFTANLFPSAEMCHQLLIDSRQQKMQISGSLFE